MWGEGCVRPRSSAGKGGMEGRDGATAGTLGPRPRSTVFHLPHLCPESLPAAIQGAQAQGYAWWRRGKKHTPPLTGQRICFCKPKI